MRAPSWFWIAGWIERVVTHRTQSARWLILFGCLLASGCGRETYERRFDETRRYFAYLDLLNQHLSGIWSGDGIELRPPKQFQMIPPPPPAKEGESPPPDVRQPQLAGIVFSGLCGAWKADLNATGGGTIKAYMYVMSNYDMLGRNPPDDQAGKFNEDITKMIVRGLEAPDSTAEKLINYEVPKGGKAEAYVEKTTYKAISPPLPFKIEDDEYRLQLYSCQKGQAQISIVFMIPDNASPSEKIDRSIDLCLETFKINQERPLTVPGAGPGAKPVAKSAI